jgi:hypothetical protein
VGTPEARRELAVNAAQALGLGLVTAGVALVFVPAAFITAGLALIAVGVLHGGGIK